jgi:putative membrane protein
MHATSPNSTRIQPQTSLLPWLLIGLWVLLMISIPILRWSVGDSVLPLATALSVAMQAAASLAVLWAGWGAGPTLRVVAVVLPLAWAVEFVGSTTGLPFGDYHYTPLLQPQVGGVPLLIPLAWLMMLPPAWAVGSLLGRTWRPLPVAAIAACAFAAWDLFLDPQMVAWGYWVWAQPGGYFGIPWINFAGWVLSAFLLSWIALAVARPPLPPLLPLIVIYTITWALQSVGLALFWGMPGPAAVGFVVMGFFVAGAWWRLRAAAVQRAEAAPTK